MHVILCHIPHYVGIGTTEGSLIIIIYAAVIYVRVFCAKCHSWRHDRLTQIKIIHDMSLDHRSLVVRTYITNISLFGTIPVITQGSFAIPLAEHCQIPIVKTLLIENNYVGKWAWWNIKKRSHKLFYCGPATFAPKRLYTIKIIQKPKNHLGKHCREPAVRH